MKFIIVSGEILSFENLVYSTFEFIVALVESTKFKKTVQQFLEDILFFTMVYMQITDEQVRRILSLRIKPILQI